jgi:transcriptional repressor OPI1
MAVKKNVVSTIRRVIDVVGKYAGGSLPEPAKQKVKGFILSLPGRWSVAVKEAGLGESWGPAAAEEASATAEGNSTSRAGPPSNSNPRKRNRLESSSQSFTSSESTAVGSVITSSSISAGPSSANLVSSRSGVVGPPGAKRSQLLPPTAGAARHAASRVLTLAQESLHAVKGVTGVFKDTLDRAEA